MRILLLSTKRGLFEVEWIRVLVCYTQRRVHICFLIGESNNYRAVVNNESAWFWSDLVIFISFDKCCLIRNHNMRILVSLQIWFVWKLLLTDITGSVSLCSSMFSQVSLLTFFNFWSSFSLYQFSLNFDDSLNCLKAFLKIPFLSDIIFTLNRIQIIFRIRFLCG